jgi:hypothetical protein
LAEVTGVWGNKGPNEGWMLGYSGVAVQSRGLERKDQIARQMTGRGGLDPAFWRPEPNRPPRFTQTAFRYEIFNSRKL